MNKLSVNTILPDNEKTVIPGDMIKKEEVEKIVYEASNGVTRVLYNNKARTPSQKFRKKITQNFDPDKITVTQAGVTFNCYDKIQEYKDDSEFYTVLEKYHCTPDEAMERLKSNATEIIGEMNFGKSYAEHLIELNKAKEMFDQLPVKIKQKFNNSIKEFAENGHEFIKNLINEQNKKQETTTPGEVNNE